MMFQRTKIDAKMKKIIEKDWQDAFPTLTKTSLCVFRRLVGPIEISVGFDYGYGTSYSPGMSVCNLLNAPKRLYAAMSVEPKSRRSSIRWEQHEKGLYKEAVEELKQLASLPLERPITLSHVLKAYQERRGKGGFYVHELEDPSLIAAWCGKMELAKELADEALNHWNKRIEEALKRDSTQEVLVDPVAWHQTLLARLNTEELQHHLNEQIVKFKLTKVPHEELIIDL